MQSTYPYDLPWKTPEQFFPYRDEVSLQVQIPQEISFTLSEKAIRYHFFQLHIDAPDTQETLVVVKNVLAASFQSARGTAKG